ncbi:hypothetical protein GCM10025768_24740 [Microbacterium pseudoresistens]|uniref:Competence protein ComEA n=1 Tax=Microbacterium pseudoresistens TaxID=640634 RepID=A0A7Y9EWN3_9MICO|nr:helix-hairpin-helix domain-containing protein [Microbacterium pseudoresistens]NYD55317.1 competence protein ComEA [Microbacterium pseudoresistens]
MPAAPDAAEDSSAPRLAPPRVRLGLGAAVVFALVVLSVTVGIGLLQGQANTAAALPTPTGSAEDVGELPGASVYVHVLGEVASPGLYVLDDGDRVADALAAAGGTLPSADLRSVNLARAVSDGEQIVVAVQGAVPTAGGSSAATGGDGMIDLNTADAAALEELPRIGPALAERIVEWREANGRFASVDDLLAVSGIGEKVLAGFRDKVRV